MTILQSINAAKIALLLIFDALIVLRIIRILMDAQLNPEQDTAKMVRNRIVVIIVVSCLTGIIIKIQSFYR